MSSDAGIHNAEVIDFIAYDAEAGAYVMVMAQARPWPAAKEAVRMVQAKVNAYLAYVTSGQFRREHPDADTSAVRFQLDYVAEPPDAVLEFVKRMQDVLRDREGIAFHVDDVSSEMA